MKMSIADFNCKFDSHCQPLNLRHSFLPMRVAPCPLRKMQSRSEGSNCPALHCGCLATVTSRIVEVSAKGVQATYSRPFSVALCRKLASEEELREQLRELEAEQGSAWNVGAVDSTRYISPPPPFDSLKLLPTSIPDGPV